MLLNYESAQDLYDCKTPLGYVIMIWTITSNFRRTHIVKRQNLPYDRMILSVILINNINQAFTTFKKMWQAHNSSTSSPFESSPETPCERLAVRKSDVEDTAVTTEKDNVVRKPEKLSDKENFDSTKPQESLQVKPNDVCTDQNIQIIEFTPIRAHEITPIGERKITPIWEREIAPIRELKVTPIREREITPIRERKVTPIGEHKITPVCEHEIALIREKTVRDTEVHLSDNRKDSSEKKAKTVDLINRSLRKSDKKKIFGTDEKTKHTPRKGNECHSCKFVEFELKFLTAKMKELEKKLKPDMKMKILAVENLSRKLLLRFERRSRRKCHMFEVIVMLKIKIVNFDFWTTHFLQEELEKKIQEFRNEMLVQKENYQKELEESCNERERLKIEVSISPFYHHELLKVDEKISVLEKEAEKEKKENSRYLSIIQYSILNDQFKEIRNSSVKQFEDRKNEVERSIELHRSAKERLYKSSEAMAKRYEAVLRETCEDNLKLYIHLQKIEKALENQKIQKCKSKVFQQKMREKLCELFEKFKDVIYSPNSKWLDNENIHYVVANFEAMLETILLEKPSFQLLIDQFTIYVEEKIFNEHSELSKVDCGDSKKASIGGQESRTLTIDKQRLRCDTILPTCDCVMFKKKFREKIHAMLNEFMKKQNEELSKSILTMLNCVKNADLRHDINLIDRVENMTDKIAAIDSKQSDFRKIEEALDHSEALVKTFSDRSNVLVRVERDSGSSGFEKEKRKLRESCVNLTSGLMKLEEKVENLEKLQQQFFFTSTPRMNRSMSKHESDDEGHKKVSRKNRPSPNSEKPIVEKKRSREKVVRRKGMKKKSKDV
uniref:Coiled-coil domain-containing protein 160 n=1 Tax=Elaeophora elaphi TaxID=1147741 RepID=A0A0R3S2G1_9BILA